VIIISHRGASVVAPENTISAFEESINLGFNHFELDVRRTSDNKLVVIHDADVSRTTNGVGLVRELSFADIKSFDAGSWFSPCYKNEKVPRLREVIKQFSHRATLHIEVKDNSRKSANLLYKAIKKNRVESKVWITSFHKKVIDELLAKEEDFNVGLLLRKDASDKEIGCLEGVGVKMICPHIRVVDRGFVEMWKAKGVLVRPWGLKSDGGLLKKAYECGVYGVTFDDISNIKKVTKV